MKPQEPTVRVKHKKNGIERELTNTQLELMGKKGRKAFTTKDPEEAGDVNALAEKNEGKRLADENAELKRQLEEALKPKQQPEATETKSQQQLQNEGQRVENNHLKAAVTSAASALETEPAPTDETEEEADDADETEESGETDPNPELTALRKSYEETTGKKPGRLGIDKMNEGIAAALKAKGQGPVEPK